VLVVSCNCRPVQFVGVVLLGYNGNTCLYGFRCNNVEGVIVSSMYSLLTV